MTELLGIRRAFLAGLVPPPRVTVSEWAERNRALTSEGSSEPGPWRNERFPFLVEIMDSLSAHSGVERVVFMKGSQVGGTEVGLNLVGYTIAHHPAPIMHVMPSEKVQKRGSLQRLDALLACDTLRGLVAEKKGREPGNTALLKVFRGGMLALATANSASDLRSMPARVLILDEIDAFPREIPGEGDPVDLAERATRTFGSSGRMRKLFYLSTPTEEGRGIAPLFAATDRRYYHVPCPFCGAEQRLEWPRLRWEKRDDAAGPETARELEEGARPVWYECSGCERRIEEWHKGTMLAAGRWIPEAPELSGRTRGYALSALYSPLGHYSWRQAAAAWVKAQGNEPKLRAFVNQTLGETFRSRIEPPEWEKLYRRRETYATGIVPEGAYVLTAGVDVQEDRMHVELVAWGPGLESWSVRYFVIPGQVERPEPWAALSLELRGLYPLEVEPRVRLPIQACCIDSSAFTATVYAWVAQERRPFLFAIKGDDRLRSVVGIPRSADTEIAGPVRGRRRGVQVWPVGVNVLKEELYGHLRLEPPMREDEVFPPGYCHHPEYPEAYFLELTAEALAQRMVRGYRRVEWVKIRPRNEALDCRVYARAAAELLGLSRRSPEEWEEIARATLSGLFSPAGTSEPRGRPAPRGADDWWGNR